MCATQWNGLRLVKDNKWCKTRLQCVRILYLDRPELSHEEQCGKQKHWVKMKFNSGLVFYLNFADDIILMASKFQDIQLKTKRVKD